MTNLNFKQLDRFFRNDDFPSIEEDVRGSRFLKLRSMSRKDTMERFCEINNIDLTGLKSKEYFEHVFENDAVTEHHINDFILARYREERAGRLENQDYLGDQLNRLQNFDWGGSFGNSLEKNIVNNYPESVTSDSINVFKTLQ